MPRIAFLNKILVFFKTSLWSKWKSRHLTIRQFSFLTIRSHRFQNSITSVPLLWRSLGSMVRRGESDRKRNWRRIFRKRLICLSMKDQIPKRMSSWIRSIPAQEDPAIQVAVAMRIDQIKSLWLPSHAVPRCRMCPASGNSFMSAWLSSSIEWIPTQTSASTSSMRVSSLEILKLTSRNGRFRASSKRLISLPR
jgi:hypothetical protein